MKCETKPNECQNGRTNVTNRTGLLHILTISACLLGSPPLSSFGATWTVSTASQLDNAWRSAAAGDEIVVNPGTYNLIASVILRVNNLTLRGSTGNRDDVVLVGGGMNTQGVNEGVVVEADFDTIKDLTVKDFYWNGIHVRAESDADSTWIQNVKTWNIGERHIKGSRNAADPNGVSDNLLIENCYMLQTIPRSGHSETGPDYIGGIDMMSLRNPVIRDNVAEGIVGSTQGGNAAIFLWQGIENAIVESNRIFGCAKGIAYGNPYLNDDPNRLTGAWHAAGGVIRNNFILRGTWTGGNNIGIELANTKDVKVAHNTVYSADASYFRTVSITDSDPSKGNSVGVVLANNIIRGALYTSTYFGGWTSTGDIIDTTGTTVTSGWFVNVSIADFHLTTAATAAIDQAPLLTYVTDDFDAQARPIGPAADIGADEFQAAPSVPAAPSNLAATAGKKKVTLNWTDNSSNETGFKIERSTDGVTFTQINTVGANTTTYTNTGLTSGTTYYFRVRAYNGTGDSAYSNTASATPR